MARKFIYAVHVGKKLGLFPTWAVTEPLVKGYPGAVHKGFGAGPGEYRRAKIFWKTGEESGTPTKWYGVINGTDTTGIYTSWTPASNAIRHIHDARVEKFRTLGSAKSWMIDNGVAASDIKILASFFQQYDNFQPVVNKPLDAEFMRLAHSQGWDPSSEEYRIKWTYTLAAEMKIEFCEPPVPDNILNDVTSEKAIVLENERWLRGCQALCEAARQTPGYTIEECVEIFNNTMIDIIDLLDEVRTGKPAKVWTDEEEFIAYTEKRTKRIHLPTAQADPFMSRFVGGGIKSKKWQG